MGGNSIEVTLVSLSNGLYRCLDSIHVLNSGGDQFTDIVVDILCEEFQKYSIYSIKQKIKLKNDFCLLFNLSKYFCI